MAQRGAKVEVKCQNKRCGTAFLARVADVKRGWGRFCSKSCKASHQEARTSQYAHHLHSVRRGVNEGFEYDADYVDYEGGGWDAHKNY